MKSIKYILIGYGQMGHMVEKIADNRGHVLSFIIDNISDWKRIDQKAKDSDIAIDFSLPEVAVDNIIKCFKAGIPIVSGTTGWYDRLPEVEKACHKHNGTLFYAPNFSLGMNMVFKMNKILAQMTNKTAYEARLSEVHHIHKKDMPSGTALRLAADIIDLNSKYTEWTGSKEHTTNQLWIDSIRLNEVPGTHEIIYSSAEDEICLRHTAYNRDGFALGAWVAAEFLLGKTGIYTMQDLIISHINGD